MVRITKPIDGPKGLTKKGTVAEKKVCAEYDKCPNDYDTKKKTLPKSRKGIYASKEVKQMLKKAQYDKCCYCEQIFRAPRDLAVEHFRPKSGVKQTRSDNEKYHPGYYWLAYNWDNLLLSCHECNSTYKQTLFPLANPKSRVRSHHQNIADERPLFVHPVLQDPRDHIRFHDEFPVHRTAVGRTTIEEIGLSRPALREARLRELKILRAFREVIVKAQKHPRSRSLQELAGPAMEFLKEAIRSDALFSSMAQDFLSDVLI